MGWTLDHVFVATTEPAVAEAELAGFGLTFNRRTVHPGQGTANVCAAFEGSFLEIVYARDEVELRSPAIRPLGLEERIRWRETGACPFGIAFRPEDPEEDAAGWPFPTWHYQAPYFPAALALPIVTPPDRLDEPLIFVMRRSVPPAGTWPAPGTSPEHLGARRAITRVTIHRPTAAPAPSPGVRWFFERGLLVPATGSEPLVELEWDGGRLGSSRQFSDAAPLRLCW
jgi:hypothetical protein